VDLAIDIPARTCRRIDIVHVLGADPGVAGTEEPEVPIRLTLARSSALEREMLPGLHYRIVFTVAGENVLPITYATDVTFEGVLPSVTSTWDMSRLQFGPVTRVEKFSLMQEAPRGLK
jgi:hypothetical protein